MRAPTESGATRRWSTHQSRPTKRGKAKHKLKVAQGKAELGAGQGQTGPSVGQGDAELGSGQGDAEHGVQVHTVRAPTAAAEGERLKVVRQNLVKHKEKQNLEQDKVKQDQV